MQTLWERNNPGKHYAGHNFAPPERMWLAVSYMMGGDEWLMYHVFYMVMALLGWNSSKFFFALFVFDPLAHSYTMQQVRMRTIAATNSSEQQPVAVNSSQQQ